MILTKLLLEKGLLTQGQLDEALAVQQAEVLRLDRAIVQLGFLTERQLLEMMAEELHLPFISLADLDIEPDTPRGRRAAKIGWRWRRRPASSSWSTRSSWRRSTSGPAIFTSNPTSITCRFATALTESCR